MKNRVITAFITGVLSLFSAAIFTGCASCKPGKPGPMGQYTINVTLDDSLKTSSVIVDIVGVNPSSLARWENYDMGKYWKEGDAMRRDADKVAMNFLSGQAVNKTVSNTDPQWEKWKNKGVTHLLVLADLPGTQVSKPGAQDARRQVLPLDECSWPPKTTELKLLVQRSGIVILTPARTIK
jgi:hypothetical protein